MVQWKKNIVKWKVGKTLYLSVPFTWLLDEARVLAEEHKGPVLAGGPAVDLIGAPWATETPRKCPYDVLSMHNPLATFTTRGCIRACAFCAVPKIEGGFRELIDWKPAPIVCDNNFFAASHSHIERVIDKLAVFPSVDFNQGLDARILSPWHLDQLKRLQHVKIRFAFDHVNNESAVSDAVNIAKAAGFRDFGMYVLIGFKDTPIDAEYRLETVRSWGIRPNPMRYQPLDALAKNAHVGNGWTDNELKRMTRYYSRLRWLEHIPFADYKDSASDDGQMSLELPTTTDEETTT